MTGESIQDYHQVTNSPNNRCKTASGVADGTDDEVKGLVLALIFLIIVVVSLILES